jgi:hypothetical protein
MNATPDRPDPDDDRLADALRASRVMHDAPEALIERAIGLWRPRAAVVVDTRTAVPPSLLQRLVATLRFDSAGAAPLAFGLRSAGGPGEVRQLLFSLEGRDIDLRIAPAGEPGRFRISGQVLGPDATGTVAFDCAGVQGETAWNELAEFGFDAVPAGDCRLVLRTDAWQAELPVITLPPAR